jgi:nucleoside-triphosphatase
MPRNLLITGVPGAGKTTALRRVADGLQGRRRRGHRARGFLTDEIRSGHRRVGFSITSLAGETAVLAHVETRSAHRVGRYGVDLEALDRLVAATLVPAATTAAPAGEAELFLIDEIGKMECFSGRFVEAVKILLEAPHPVVASVARRGAGFIDAVKRRDDVTLWHITRENRDELPARILAWIEDADSA